MKKALSIYFIIIGALFTVLSSIALMNQVGNNILRDLLMALCYFAMVVGGAVALLKNKQVGEILAGLPCFFLAIYWFFRWFLLLGLSDSNSVGNFVVFLLFGVPSFILIRNICKS